MPFFFLAFMIKLAAVLKSPAVKGWFGELGVRLALKRLDKETFEVLHNITLKTNDATTQLDHIVVGSNGIFVIETKNYKGWIFGSEHSAQWTQTIYRSKHRFHNPVHQNYGHIKTLQTYLPGYTDPMVSIVNFTGNSELKKIDIRSERVHVIHTGDLVRTIRSYREPVLSRSLVLAYAEHLSKANIMDRQSKKQHVAAIKLTQARKKAQTAANICPKCGEALIARCGKHGSFTGCSAYPKCRFTA
jgi:predicted RNA-binding Zn-ribbon protein involved in translation (DUF1610 family)